MKKSLATLLVLTSFACLRADETPVPEKKETVKQETDISKISEAFGHLIGKNLDNIGVEFDIAQVIKGLQDASAGKSSPMSETECVQAIAAVQEKAFKEQSLANLSKAENFLKENKKMENVISLEEGKIQYKIEKPGTGPLVESHYSPMIRYTGRYLDGSIFGQSNEEQVLSLDEVIPGLKSGIIGMKEGEKRTIYIHPDLAYGTNGYLPPNSLLSFEIELIKANAPEAEPVDSISTQTGTLPNNSEIAEPETHIR